MSMKLEALGERKFKIKLKSKTEDYAGSKVQNPVPLGCNKRKREAEVEEQPSKKWKMDPTVKRQCRGVLDALLAHRHSRVFNCPVDPVALRIPDYFTVISHPMDLGTIKSKLTTSAYYDTQEFAADVKLTFSNAMLYNPPDHPVHSMAKELEALFLKRWKLLEAKWNHGILVSAPQAYGDQRIGLGAGKTCSTNSAPLGLPVRESKPRMSVDEKKKLKKDLTEILVGRMAEKLKIEFSKLGIEIPRKEIIDHEFDRFGEDVLWQLKKVVEENGCRFLSKSIVNSGVSVGAFDGKSKSSSLLCHGAAAKSVVLNGKTDLQKASTAARSVKMTVSESVDKPNPNGKSKSSFLSNSVVSKSNGETDLQKALNAARSAKMNKSNSGGSVGVASAKSVLLNEETDLQKALNAARLVKMKKESAAKVNCDSESGKVVQEAKARPLVQQEANARPGKVQQEAMANSKNALADSRIEERNALAALEEKSKGIANEDNKVGSYNELVKLSGCSISFDSYHGVVLKLRELKTGKVVDPLASIGLHLKKDFIADVSDYDEYVSDAEMEEGEILQ